MNEQIEQLVSELNRSTAKLHEISDSLDDQRWSTRSTFGGWSVCECVLHLNLTTRNYIPIIQQAVDKARREEIKGSGVFKRDFQGWMLCLFIEPPARMKIKTLPSFTPETIVPKGETIAEFERLQSDLSDLMRSVEDLNLNRIKIGSPFNSRVSYNLYSTFKIVACHQRRHLWQAEQVLKRSI